MSAKTPANNVFTALGRLMKELEGRRNTLFSHQSWDSKQATINMKWLCLGWQVDVNIAFVVMCECFQCVTLRADVINPQRSPVFSPNLNCFSEQIWQYILLLWPYEALFFLQVKKWKKRNLIFLNLKHLQFVNLLWIQDDIFSYFLRQ